MVLERLITIRTALKNPWTMFLVGGIVSVTSLIIAFLVFEAAVGLFTNFLITFTMIPLMLDLIRYEAVRVEALTRSKRGTNLLQKYRNLIKVYIAFFSGMIFALSILYVMLPEELVNRLFQDQIREIGLIRGSATFFGTFGKIISNNLSVLSLTFLFSFLFGAGAIFILSWNASVLAAAIGMAARSIGGLRGLPLAVLVFFPHGSLEILAYFIAGIAGGIVSVAVTKRKSLGFWHMFYDAVLLMLVSVWLLIVAAFIESFSIIL
jgi:uncharacterized membrane protein SpoIIM required for sporulation